MGRPCAFPNQRGDRRVALLRLLLIYVAAVSVVAAGVIWAIFEYDLLPFHGTQAVAAQAEAPERAVAPKKGRIQSRGVASAAIPAHALDDRRFNRSPLPLSLPVDCEPGVDCWIFNFVDLDPGKGRRDFACGQMSYDTHKGTDIALAHMGRLNDMVPVRAAAAGTVLGARDGMKDVSIRTTGRAAVKGKECGNGVRVDHGGGWHTQYCHLKRGSVLVGSGDRVRSGDRIGAVGLSGLTEFPHLHMTVEKEGKVVDPFVGLSGGEECDIGRAPLWRREVLEKLRYLSAIPYNLGFADHVPKAERIRAGELDSKSLSAGSKALIFWAEVAGLRPKDFVSMRFFGPDGAVLAKKEETMAKHRIRIWWAIGKKSKTSWPPGVYRGEITILRDTPAGPMEARRDTRLDVF
jgi:murein DD-endopeptidase MepM/ murein hydrolase activator NlpD